MRFDATLTIAVASPELVAVVKSLADTLTTTNTLLASIAATMDPRLQQLAQHLADQTTKLKAAVDAAKP